MEAHVKPVTVNHSKLERKLRKLQHIVFKETGISCSLTPSQYLVICNAGLVNGLSEESIVEHFSLFGTLEDIALIPGKSCCFVSYNDVNSSKRAFAEYNGKLNIAQYNKPIYLLYAETRPAVESYKIWNTLPPGLIIIENFITECEETLLMNLCTFEQEQGNGHMKNRQVKHYGYEFRYDINNVDKNKPLVESIPEECDILWKRLQPTKFDKFIPDQLTVNHYMPGHGIPSHVDTHSAFEDPILSLSLQSAIIMEFKKDDKHICVHLPRRSLCIMSGESRYDWAHGITPRKFDTIRNNEGFNLLERGTRVSYTFRKILRGECNCQFEKKCDSHFRRINNVNLEQDKASHLEKEHVHKIYENIAPHFSETRHKPWPNVLEFVQSFEPGSILYDVGCGNGKYLGLNENVYSIGCDTSFSLLSVCKEKGFETFTANCLKLPFKDNTADGVLSIAVIHHLANQDRRHQAISEMIRVLKTNGMALIYVWAKDQHKNDQKTSYIKQDRKNRKVANIVTNQENEQLVNISGMTLPVHVNRTQFKHKDILVPWNLKTNDKSDSKFLRYYHVFEENELEEMCSKYSNIKIEKSYYDQGNWCIIVRKISENKT